jgi:hypothetical protein
MSTRLPWALHATAIGSLIGVAIGILIDADIGPCIGIAGKPLGFSAHPNRQRL